MTLILCQVSVIFVTCEASCDNNIILNCCLYVCYRQVSSNDYPSLDTLTKTIVKEKQPFIRLEMTKEDLLEMFKVKSVYET